MLLFHMAIEQIPLFRAHTDFSHPFAEMVEDRRSSYDNWLCMRATRGTLWRIQTLRRAKRIPSSYCTSVWKGSMTDSLGVAPICHCWHTIFLAGLNSVYRPLLGYVSRWNCSKKGQWRNNWIVSLMNNIFPGIRKSIVFERQSNR